MKISNILFVNKIFNGGGDEKCSNDPRPNYETKIGKEQNFHYHALGGWMTHSGLDLHLPSLGLNPSSLTFPSGVT